MHVLKEMPEFCYALQNNNMIGSGKEGLDNGYPVQSAISPEVKKHEHMNMQCLIQTHTHTHTHTACEFYG